MCVCVLRTCFTHQLSHNQSSASSERPESGISFEFPSSVPTKPAEGITDGACDSQKTHWSEKEQHHEEGTESRRGDAARTLKYSEDGSEDEDDAKDPVSKGPKVPPSPSVLPAEPTSPVASSLGELGQLAIVQVRRDRNGFEKRNACTGILHIERDWEKSK